MAKGKFIFAFPSKDEMHWLIVCTLFQNRNIVFSVMSFMNNKLIFR